MDNPKNIQTSKSSPPAEGRRRAEPPLTPKAKAPSVTSSGKSTPRGAPGFMSRELLGSDVGAKVESEGNIPASGNFSRYYISSQKSEDSRSRSSSSSFSSIITASSGRDSKVDFAELKRMQSKSRSVLNIIDDNVEPPPLEGMYPDRPSIHSRESSSSSLLSMKSASSRSSITSTIARTFSGKLLRENPNREVPQPLPIIDENPLLDTVLPALVNEQRVVSESFGNLTLKANIIPSVSESMGDESDHRDVDEATPLPSKRQKPPLFPQAIRSISGKFAKYSHQGFDTGIRGSSGPRPISTSSRNSFAQAISNLVHFDGGFSTVYSADAPRDSRRVYATEISNVFQPSESSGSSNDMKVDGGVDISSPNYRIPPTGLNSKDNFKLITDALKKLGISNRKESVMDFDFALLLQLMNPDHVYGQMCSPDLDFHHIYDSALRANEMEIERLSNELSNDHPDVISLKLATADVYKGLGMPQSAEVLLRQVLDSQKRVYGNYSPFVSTSLNELALLLLATGRYGEAQSLFEDVVDVECKNGGDDNPEVAIALGNLAIALRFQAKFITAIPVHERCLQILEDNIDKNDYSGIDREFLGPELLYQRGQLGITFIHMGVMEKGLPIVLNTLKNLNEKSKLHVNHPWILSLQDQTRIH